MPVSESQKKTRRRALGRKLVKNSSDLHLMLSSLEASADLEFMTSTERKKFDKLAQQLGVVAQHFDAIGTEMDK